MTIAHGAGRAARTMHLMLNAAERPRYLEDMMRVLSMPHGSYVRYRYQLRHLHEDIRENIARLRDVPCLIAYIDQHDSDAPPRVVPCRFARIVRAERHGSTASALLELGNFAFAPDLDAVNVALREQDIGLPVTKRNTGVARRFYWTQLRWRDATNQIDLTEINDGFPGGMLAGWEEIVRQVSASPVFDVTRVFYIVDSLKCLASGHSPEFRIQPENGVFRLLPNKEYIIRLYHFHPNKNQPGQTFRFSSSQPNVELITNPELLIDSPYDRKEVRFLTGEPSNKQTGRLSIFREELGGTGTPLWQFDIEIAIASAKRSRLLQGIGLGILLAFPQVLIISRTKELVGRGPLVVMVIVAALLTGIFASFNLKKTL